MTFFTQMSAPFINSIHSTDRVDCSKMFDLLKTKIYLPILSGFMLMTMLLILQLA